MFESQWKPKPARPNMHPACKRDPAYWDGYNDAGDGLRFDARMLGGTDYESEEYRAGYLQACAEQAGRLNP